MAGAPIHKRDHDREVERRDTADDTQRLADREQVDIAADIGVELAFDQVRDPAGEFDDVDAALNLALGIGNRFAVFAAEGFRQGVAVLDQKFAEREQNGRAFRNRGRGPFRACLNRDLDRLVHVRGGCVGQRADHFARRGVVDFAAAAAVARNFLTADPMIKLFRHVPSHTRPDMSLVNQLCGA